MGSGGAFVALAYDATPVLVDFGRLAPLVLDCARYLVKNEDRPGWRAVSLEAFKELRGNLLPKFGVVETMGLTTDLFWMAGELARAECIVSPALVLKRANASTINAGVHGRRDSITIERLHELAKSGPFILQECPDSCKANLRKMAYTSTVLPKQCLYAGSRTCAAHLCQLIIVHSSQEKTVIGDTHACEVIGQQPRLFAKIIAGLHKWLNDNLIIHNCAPPEWLHEVRDFVLSHTLRREADHVRGRLPSADPSGAVFDVARDHASIERACAKLSCFWNGDFRRAVPEHYSVVPVDRAEIISSMVTAAVEAGLVRGYQSSMPSKNKWGSCVRSMSKQVAGFVFHDALGNAVSRAMTTWEDGDPSANVDGDDNEYRVYIKSKVSTVRCC